MIPVLSIIVLGFVLGMRHATDPDHVIAVTAIVSRQSTIRSAMLIGGVWGIGHTLTIVLVGGAIIVFNVVIPPRLGLSMELAVAFMLVLLGILNLTGIMRWIQGALAPAGELHSHGHSHGDYVHSHAHGHGAANHGHREDQTPQAWLDQRLAWLGLYQTLRPLVVGVVHGLAGSAAVALLVLTAMPNPVWAMVYLLLFGVGTIAGMMLITAAIGLPFAYTAARLTRLNRYLGLASGVLSLGFGLFLVYQIGFVDGLFTSHPRWVPE
ncbi:MAG: high-affinity nickel-transport family protein [Candidatus Rokuibacteriota bacterium]|nr:MAG: high-affinity nickel-transport family protein [Candidatus Rokubacteria bacterium]